MYTVELYVKIRRAVMVEGRSERECALFWYSPQDCQEDVSIRGTAGLLTQERTIISQACSLRWHH